MNESNRIFWTRDTLSSYEKAMEHLFFFQNRIQIKKTKKRPAPWFHSSSRNEWAMCFYLMEVSVDERIQRRIEVTDPEEDFDYDVRTVARVAAQHNRQVPAMSDTISFFLVEFGSIIVNPSSRFGCTFRHSLWKIVKWFLWFENNVFEFYFRKKTTTPIEKK